jgi:hypothetical protein
MWRIAAQLGMSLDEVFVAARQLAKAAEDAS